MKVLRTPDERFDKPFLKLFGAKDAVTQDGEKSLIAQVPGAAGQPHHVFPDTSRFLQEDVPDPLVERILAFVGISARAAALTRGTPRWIRRRAGTARRRWSD